MPDRAATARRNKQPNVVVEHIDEIVLDGMKVQVRGLDLPLDSVQLDPTNPRVANAISMADFGSGEDLQQSLKELLWSDSDVHSLYRSVLENKGLVERINALTGKPYRGVNVVMLWAHARQRHLESRHWATYRQWRELGGQVRRGERSSTIVFYKEIEVGPSEGRQGEEGELPSKRLVARASRVFNAAQVDGWQAPTPPPRSRFETLEKAEAFVRATGAAIREQGNHAYYNPGADHIQVPPRESFIGTPTSSPTETFYSTLCHELTHNAAIRIMPRLLGRAQLAV